MNQQLNGMNTIQDNKGSSQTQETGVVRMGRRRRIQDPIRRQIAHGRQIGDMQLILKPRAIALCGLQRSRVVLRVIRQHAAAQSNDRPHRVVSGGDA